MRRDGALLDYSFVDEPIRSELTSSLVVLVKLCSTQLDESKADYNMSVVRLRTRDGIERIYVPSDATVSVLRQAIGEQIKRPAQQFVISMDQTLVCLSAL